MRCWALIMFILALVSGLFGFAGADAAEHGRIQALFFVFLVLLMLFLMADVRRGGSRRA